MKEKLNLSHMILSSGPSHALWKSQKKKNEKGAQKILEEMIAENLPNFTTHIHTQTHKYRKLNKL